MVMNDGEIQAFRTQLINPRAIGDGGCGIQVFVKFIFITCRSLIKLLLQFIRSATCLIEKKVVFLRYLVSILTYVC